MSSCSISGMPEDGASRAETAGLTVCTRRSTMVSMPAKSLRRASAQCLGGLAVLAVVLFVVRSAGPGQAADALAGAYVDTARLPAEVKECMDTSVDPCDDFYRQECSARMLSDTHAR